MRKASAFVMIALVAVAALAACDGPAGPAGPTGATGPQGPAGARGAIGPQGVSGDANVTVYEYGPLEYSATGAFSADSFLLAMPNLPTAKRDSSAILAYAYAEENIMGGGGVQAAWWTIPGPIGDSVYTGGGVTYPSSTESNTQIMPVFVVGYRSITIDKVRIFVIASSHIYGASPSIGRTMDYQSLVRRLNLLNLQE